MSKNKSQTTGNKTSKNRFAIISILILVLIVAVIFIFFNFNSNSQSKSNEINNDMKNTTVYSFKKEGELVFTKTDGTEISVLDIEIADNDVQLMNGLMYRTSMKENQGMLFIFPYETEQSFWMKNTVISLDMIFVNSAKEIVKIHHNTTPFSEESYSSEKPAQFVIEVNAGYTAMGIKEGDKVIWKRD